MWGLVVAGVVLLKELGQVALPATTRRVESVPTVATGGDLRPFGNKVPVRLIAPQRSS